MDMLKKNINDLCAIKSSYEKLRCYIKESKFMINESFKKIICIDSDIINLISYFNVTLDHIYASICISSYNIHDNIMMFQDILQLCLDVDISKVITVMDNLGTIRIMHIQLLAYLKHSIQDINKLYSILNYNQTNIFLNINIHIIAIFEVVESSIINCNLNIENNIKNFYDIISISLNVPE